MKGETIPVIVLAEHEHLNLDSIQRCACGSSLFRLIREQDDINLIPEYKDGKIVGGEVWLGILDVTEVCAVCGAVHGGMIDAIGQKATIKLKDLKLIDADGMDRVRKGVGGNVRTD